MLRDERGQEMREGDAVRMSFPKGVICSGVVHQYIVHTPTAKGKKSGRLIVTSTWAIDFADLENEVIEGIVRYEPGADYAAASTSAAAAVPKGKIQVKTAKKKRAA